MDGALETGQDQLEQAANNPAVEWMARVGYFARGFVYLLVGGLAAAAAIGAGGETTGPRGALAWLLHQPWGRALLIPVGVGMACLALWCMVQAVADADRRGRSAKGLAVRAGRLGAGLVAAGLSLTAFSLGMGWGAVRSEEGVVGWTARLMRQPLGRWLVAALGIGVAVYGAWQLYRGWIAKLDRRLSLGRMSAGAQRAVRGFGRFGIAARGVVFCIIGICLVLAAVRYDPTQATGVEGTLDTVASQRFGALLLLLVALGFVSYGLLQLVLGRYRRIVPAEG